MYSLWFWKTVIRQARRPLSRCDVFAKPLYFSIFADDETTVRDSDSPMTAITDQTAASTYTTTTDKTFKERLAHEMGLQVCYKQSVIVLMGP